ncbi:MAG: sialate O-acetylesterase [Kiritimatiellales bacterium]|jgi:sialate O-acetylesterase
MKTPVFVLLTLMLFTGGAHTGVAAEFKLAAIFNDHAVLQRDVEVPVWGWAEAGTKVTVEFAGQKKSATADADGKWLVKLDPLKVNAEPGTLTVTAANVASPILIKDILVGEVWLGSGQSNMAMLVDMANDADKERSAANLPMVRMYKENSLAAGTAQPDSTGNWVVCAPDKVGSFSATLYFFGREIHRKLGVPVGLINASVSGSSIEAWISSETQYASKELAPFFAAVEHPEPSGLSEEVKEKYNLALARWQTAAKKAQEEGKPAPRRPRNPAVVLARQSGVGGFFNGKISPIVPYAIRGAVWYQGEGNVKPTHAPFYQYQLPMLVSDWRKHWGYEFPFAWVQLPNFREKPDGDWVTIREAQLKTLALPKTGMSVNIDIGEENGLHPKNKQEIGRRLSLWALGDVYNQKVAATSGPLPAGHEIRNNEIVLSFKHTNGGLVAKDGELKGFIIAGEDMQWKPAKARIEEDKIIVSSPDVKRPAAVRYAWENFPVCNLFNGAGLPASPFRTDDWKPSGNK